MAEPRKAKPKAAAAASEKKTGAESDPKAKPKPKAAKSEAKPKPKSSGASSKSKSPSSSDIYTDPKLRDKLKDEITAGDKGGKPGQWSARKAQLLSHEYEKAGGDYKNGKKKKTESQQHLDSWTKEDWHTSDGKPAEREGGTTRYLPDKAWEELTPEEKKATDAKKQAGSEKGKQFVANTEEAKTARKKATSKSSSTSHPSSASKSKPKAQADSKAKAQPKPKTKSAGPKARKKSSA